MTMVFLRIINHPPFNRISCLERKMKMIKNWLLSFVIAFAVFYLMDHAMMSMQSLPLNIDMTPAQ